MTERPQGCICMRSAEAAAAIFGQYRHAELGVVLAAREMRSPHQGEIVAEYAEERVAFEVDTRDVGAHRAVGGRRAEAQPPVLGPERKQVLLVSRAVE